MAYTHSLLASATVGSGGAAEINFTNIPQNYTDLCLKISARSNDATYREIWLTINGSTTNGSARALRGDGANTATSYTASRVQATGYTNTTGSTANTFTSVEIYIPNYTSTNFKSFSSEGVTENNTTQAFTELDASIWSNSSAITSISLVLSSGASFVQNSTAYLYGIRAGEY
jgi:hypothetical protein